jgi:uncharacterized membrane protein
MRSWRSLALVIALVGCGTEPPPSDDGGGSDDTTQPEPNKCDSSYLSYENFGAPFVINWCRGCHSSAVPANMRQKAPIDANFDDLAEIRTWADRMKSRATGTMPNMPPAGGPTAEERALLAEWLACGVK